MSGGKSEERLGGRLGEMDINRSQLLSPDEGLVCTLNLGTATFIFQIILIF